MASVITLDSFSPAAQPEFIMKNPRKREVEHVLQSGNINLDRIAVKDVMELHYNSLTQAEFNALMLIYSATGVNSKHTLTYSTPKITRIWDGTTASSAYTAPSVVSQTPFRTGVTGVGLVPYLVSKEMGYRFSVITNGGYIRSLWGKFDSGGYPWNVTLWNMSSNSPLVTVQIISAGDWVFKTLPLLIPVYTGVTYMVSVSTNVAQGSAVFQTHPSVIHPVTLGNVNLLAVGENTNPGQIPNNFAFFPNQWVGLVDVEWYNPSSGEVAGVNNDVGRVRNKVMLDAIDPRHKENIPDEYTVVLECKET